MLAGRPGVTFMPRSIASPISVMVQLLELVDPVGHCPHAFFDQRDAGEVDQTAAAHHIKARCHALLSDSTSLTPI